MNFATLKTFSMDFEPVIYENPLTGKFIWYLLYFEVESEHLSLISGKRRRVDQNEYDSLDDVKSAVAKFISGEFR